MSLSLPVFLAGVPLAVISHEAGHALIGYLAGMPPRIINLGLGPVIWAGRWRKLLVIVRVFLIQGYVQTVWRPDRRSWSRMAFALGGVGGNLVVFGILAAISALRVAASPACATLAAAQCYVAILTLIPWPSRIDGQRSGSDGLQFLRHLLGRGPDSFPGLYRQLVAAVDPAAAGQAIPSDGIAEALIALNRFGGAKPAWERRYWVDCLRDQIYAGVLSAPERVLVLDQALNLELASRRGDLTPLELETWSSEILVLSQTPSCRVTRAGVLVLLGRPAEARSLLHAVTPAELTPFQQSACAAFRAQASAALGDFAASAEAAKEARTIAAESRKPANVQRAETLLAFIKPS